MKYKYLWMIPCLSLLTGCVSLTLPSQSHAPYHKKTWSERHKALASIRSWNIDGAFSIQQANAKPAIASYTWQQQGSAYDIHISSSLDIDSANIAGRPGYVTLEQSHRRRYSARSPEQLMQKQLGWHLPISNLFYWMRGLPAPGKYQARFDSYGHLVSLQQAGWQIRFSNYFPIANVALPRTLALVSPSLRVKIVIKHWKL